MLKDLFQAAGNVLSVEEFMRAALYHPEVGYYSAHVRGIGARSDFSTSATLHPAFGQAMARWALKRRAILGWSWKWHLIEVGGGTGQLAVAFLDSLPPLAKRRVIYHIVETSPTLTSLQEKALDGYAVRWHTDIKHAIADAGGEALVISNELVDAFPCVQIERAQDGWREVKVSPGARGFAELLAPFADQRAGMWPSSVISSARNFPAGQRCEIHFAYAAWLSELAAALEKGRLLTVDYGDTVDELYYRRPRGTLRGYVFHTMVQGLQVYERFGRQDLTADVNFTDLAAWGEACGLRAVELLTQRDFMLRYLPQAETRAERDSALAFLLNADGVGGMYKVLEQAPSSSHAS